MSNHARLKELGLTPTSDVEAAYEAGRRDGCVDLRDELHSANERLERLSRLLTEIGLLAGRAR